MRTLAILLLLTAPAFGESFPGFSLYGHVAEAESVVLATVDAKGRAKVIDLIRGKPIPGGALTLDPVFLRLNRAGEDRRALLFITEGRLIGGFAGAAWIHNDRVYLFAGSPGGIRGKGYRAPTLAQLRKSVEIVALHVAEVRRIAGMEPGRDRILALSRLLLAAETEFAWYVFTGDSILSILDLWFLERNCGSRGRGHSRTYIEEVRTALLASIDDWSGEEQEALMAAIRNLPPGRSRREHLDILVCA